MARTHIKSQVVLLCASATPSGTVVLTSTGKKILYLYKNSNNKVAKKANAIKKFESLFL